MTVKKKFKSAVNRNFNDKGGVFWKGLTDDQLSTFIMKKLEEFARAGGKTLEATLTIGHQSNKKFVDALGNFSEESIAGQTEEDKVEDFDSAIYILNERTQVKNASYVNIMSAVLIYCFSFLRLGAFSPASLCYTMSPVVFNDCHFVSWGIQYCYF